MLKYFAYEGVGEEAGKWGVEDGAGHNQHLPTFTKAEAEFLAGYMAAHPETDYDQDVAAVEAWRKEQDERIVIRRETAKSALDHLRITRHQYETHLREAMEDGDKAMMAAGARDIANISGVIDALEEAIQRQPISTVVSSYPSTKSPANGLLIAEMWNDLENVGHDRAKLEAMELPELEALYDNEFGRPEDGQGDVYKDGVFVGIAMDSGGIIFGTKDATGKFTPRDQ